MSQNEDQQAYDSATVAWLRACERNGTDRQILGDMSPRDQEKVFDAEARHLRRVRGK